MAYGVLSIGHQNGDTPKGDKMKNLYGVFIWMASGIYKHENAIRIYVVRSNAERLANKLTTEHPDTAGGYVVRKLA